jgi:hypothetical protein
MSLKYLFPAAFPAVSYPMLRMTHPSRNYFVLSLFCILCMFVWLRTQGFESSVNKVFQKEKLVNSKTIINSTHLKELVQHELN